MPAVRSRAMRARIAGAALLLPLLCACVEDGSVQTRVRFAVPPMDEEARALTAIDVDVYPVGTICDALDAWHASMCGRADCTLPPEPEEEPLATVRLTRTGDAWAAMPLALPDQGPWDVRARAGDGEGRISLHGCVTVSSQVTERLRLWRPWCGAVPACADLDPLCPEVLDCEAILARTDVGYPPCRVVEAECRECLPGTVQPCAGAADAGGGSHCEMRQCSPDGVLEACGGEALETDVCDPGGIDEDCDGEAFGEEAHRDCEGRRGDPARPAGNRCSAARGGCVCEDLSGATAVCGDDQACCASPGGGAACVSTRSDPAHCGGCGRACAPGAACSNGHCVAPGGPDCVRDPAGERCNGRDDDCNGRRDDGVAVDHCRPLDGPALTDGCRGLAGCGCGDGDPCPAIADGRRQRCCAGRCVPEEDCGG